MAVYKTLVVAPTIISIPTPQGIIDGKDYQLPNAPGEIAAIVSALGAGGLLQGEVTSKMVTDELQRGWDIVWFVTHGDENGIWLSRQVITASQLIQAIRSSGAKLIVINTCSSYEVAAAIHSELRTYLVATLRPVFDQDATTTGRLLAAALGRGDSFPAAFNAAIPGRNNNYVYLPGKEERPIATSSVAKGDEEVGRYVDSAEKLSNLVQQISWMLYGVPGVQDAGLVNNVSLLTKKVDSLEKSLDRAEIHITQLEGRLRNVTNWLIGVIIALIGLSMAVAAYTFSAG